MYNLYISTRWGYFDFAKSGSMTANSNTSSNVGFMQRVIISYPRTDGEQFAMELWQ